MKRLRRMAASVLALLLAGWAAPGETPPRPSAALRSGPMLGYAELTEAAIWVQTTAPAAVSVRYWPAGEEARTRTSPAVSATEASHRTALLVLSGLEPGTRYAYEVLIDGAAVRRPYETSFATQRFWQYRENPPAFIAAVGSCYFANEPKSDRPGKPYGRSPAIFERIAEKKPDLMLWLGDNVYYREPDFGSAAALRERNALAREEPALQRLLAAARHYATWDDHDYGRNNSVWTYALSQNALDVFKLYWANPTYGHRDIGGVFGVFQWADVDFFLLDDRWYRTPENAADASTRRMFGPEQLRWLKDALLSSSAPFKVVANGSQMLNANTAVDTLRIFPREYKELTDWIVSNRIPGVLFLSGDKHHAELIRETPPGFYTLYDFTSSPLTAGLSLDKGEQENPQRVPGTLVADDQNFGLLRFSGLCNDRLLTMETYDSKGTLRWKHEVRARDLVAPGTPEKEIRGHSACRWLKVSP